MELRMEMDRSERREGARRGENEGGEAELGAAKVAEAIVLDSMDDGLGFGGFGLKKMRLKNLMETVS